MVHEVQHFTGLLADVSKKEELKSQSKDFLSHVLTTRQICDLELLLNGGFSPLKGYLNKVDYESVLHTQRLADGSLWPIPITLDIPEVLAIQLKPGMSLSLRDREGVMLAVLDIEDIWLAEKEKEAELVYGTQDTKHWGVHYLLNDTEKWYVGGKIQGIQLPLHYDFKKFRHTPNELKNIFQQNGWDKVVAFQTRNPLHRAHFELTKQAAQEVGGALLLHPVVGQSKAGDIDHFTRVRCYQHIMEHYPQNQALLSLLPLSMRMGGPREALWHALIRKNYGCTHMIIGRDHAGPGMNSQGLPFYGAYDAQEHVKKYESEIGIEIVDFENMVYVPELDRYQQVSKVNPNHTVQNISGTQLREKLENGESLPTWFTFPKVSLELRKTYPAKNERGMTLFFTGLSGAGKSTIAKGLSARLEEVGGRKITLLDGDEVRHFLSSELGFSKEHRSINVLRNGYVAKEVSKNGGIAICSLIAPADEIRKKVRNLVGYQANFVLIHVSTPLKVCEERDRKGLYAKAREGKIPNFTGISDPYDEPKDAELVIDTSKYSPEESVDLIMNYLLTQNYI